MECNIIYIYISVSMMMECNIIYIYISEYDDGM